MIEKRSDHLNIRPIKNTFHKQERLCSKKQMELLFKEGISQASYPIKLVYLETPVELIYPAQSMFVVPKRLFKKAHDRNTLKRRMREAYRLNKNTLYETILEKNKKMLFAFIYISKKEEEYAAIEKAVKKLIQKL